MGLAKTLGVGICRFLQGIVTLGVMVVIPVGWFFFGWRGPVESALGSSFAWRVVDGVLWTIASMVAMFITVALERLVQRLSATSELRPLGQPKASPPSPPSSFYGDRPETFGKTSDGGYSEEVAYNQAVEAYMAKMGWYEKVLLRQGTDREFGIATIKLYRAGFQSKYPAAVIGAFVMEAVNRYEPDRRLALAFAEALENQIYAKPQDQAE